MGAQGSSNHIILGGAPFELEKVVSITVPEISIKILISVSNTCVSGQRAIP